MLGTPVLWKCFKASIEDGAYVRDQRLKKGPKGLYQMASVERVAVKRALYVHWQVFRGQLLILPLSLASQSILPQTLTVLQYIQK